MRAWDWSIHHRRGRDGRSDSHRPQNLVSLCGADNHNADCHGWVHQNSAQARAVGLWLSRVAGDDPLFVPVEVFGAREPVYLTADGRYAAKPDG
jgi:hypothetical protein